MFDFFQEGRVELLAEASDQGGCFACTGRAQDQQALVERETENLILVLIEDGLIPQSHLGNDAAANAVDDVGLDGLLSQQLTKNVFGGFLPRNLGQQRTQRLDGERPEMLGFNDGVARVPPIGKRIGPKLGPLKNLNDGSIGKRELCANCQ